MRATNVELARTIWLFTVREMNCSGRSYTKAISQLAGKYDFKRFPKSMLDIADGQALVFEQGDFTTADGRDISFDFKMYDDGLIVDSRSSTCDSQQILEEITRWLESAHGFGIPSGRSVKVRYLSRLAVQADRKLNGLSSAVQVLADRFAAEVSRLEGQPVRAGFGGIHLWPHDEEHVMPIAPFRFELRNGVPLSENRYFAQAPLETNVHVKLLDELEELLS